MRTVLLDINVVLDVLADREPFAEAAQGLLGEIEAGVLRGVIAAHTVTTLHYLLARELSKRRVKRVLTDLLHIVGIVPVDEDRLRHALAMDWTDLDDALQAVCAEAVEADFLVTRDKKGFKRSSVRSVTPAEMLVLAAS